MSVLGLERNLEHDSDVYDHAINLVDATRPKVDGEESIDDPSSSIPVSRVQTDKHLERQWTRGHLRKELARRRYAKWQEGKNPDVSAAGVDGEENDPRISQKQSPETDTSRMGRLRDKVPFRTKKKSLKHDNEQDSFIDVLYENQRGSFFCGIPLYSSASLLNFDPAGWQSSTFQDSPVNITNAQLPDPGWRWDWRSWYVDMSYDVDEEGWQYSLSFGTGFAWHGNHPWFHSFVRRRRWLRKRVRISPYLSREKHGGINDAHMLTADYFTIHAAKRERSRGSSADRTTNNRSSFAGTYSGASESDEDVAEIEDVSALMAALKRARVDREKIAAVKTFVAQGGDELYYLADAMSTIMDDFVHQTSRRQLQTYLLQALDEATKPRQDDADNGGNSPAEAGQNSAKSRIDHLLKAIHAAGVHTNDVSYWSSLRARKTSSKADPTTETHALDAAEPVNIPTQAHPRAHSDDDGGEVKEEIKGIPKEAQTSEEPGIRFDTKGGEGEGAGKVLDKGKGKA